MKRTLVYFQILNLLFVITLLAATPSMGKEFVIKQCYDRLGDKKIQILVIMKFEDPKDFATENAILRVFLIDSDGKERKQIGQVDLYPLSIPLQMWRVRLNSQTEIAYLISVTGHRSREIVVRITPKGSANIFEVVGFDLLKEEVLDIDGDGVDEIILYRGNATEGKKPVKEVYKYRNGTFEKISQSPDFASDWLPSCR